MLLDNYVTDSEQETIQKEYCDKIVKFKEFRKTLMGWYCEFDFQYPHSSENNYRDSWFHYRKMYQEHSAYQVACQIATFEEHLQRAEKDAIIYFWQNICELLEVWYFFDIREEDILLSDADKIKALKFYDDTEEKKSNHWVYSLRKQYDSSVSNFAYACIYIAKHRIITLNFRRDVQKLLHQIKNIILNIRIGGAEIQRLNQPGDYIKLCNGSYRILQDICRKYRIKELICMTEIITMQIKNDA